MTASVSSFGGAVYGAALYLLRNNGLRPKEDVSLLAGGTNSARIALLKQGLVDAALNYTRHFLASLEAQGVPVLNGHGLDAVVPVVLVLAAGRLPLGGRLPSAVGS